MKNPDMNTDASVCYRSKNDHQPEKSDYSRVSACNHCRRVGVRQSELRRAAVTHL